MPDNKQIPNTDNGGSEPGLSDLISSVKENIDKTKDRAADEAAEPASPKKPAADDKPDISFKRSSTADALEKRLASKPDIPARDSELFAPRAKTEEPRETTPAESKPAPVEKKPEPAPAPKPAPAEPEEEPALQGSDDLKKRIEEARKNAANSPAESKPAPVEKNPEPAPSPKPAPAEPEEEPVLQGSDDLKKRIEEARKNAANAPAESKSVPIAPVDKKAEAAAGIAAAAAAASAETSAKKAASAQKKEPAKAAEDTRKRPQNASQSKKSNGNANKKKRPANAGNGAAAQKGKRPPNGSRPANGNKKPAPKKVGEPEKDPETTEENGKKKKKLTSKQVATVGGLIIVLLLVLIVIVIWLFNHYFKMLEPAESINNSAEKLYSDVDLSRDDTFDKVSEDEKLKELIAAGKKISNKDVMNILLIGEDLRDTNIEDSAGNTDVMMVISVNTKDKTITMTSVMRDCYVTFENNGWWYSTRINAAYWYGGAELTQKTIEDYLGVQIDRYVLVNMNVFIDIVDSLGGINITVTDEEANGNPWDDFYGDNTRGMQNPLNEQNYYLGNEPGTDFLESGGENLLLNGNQALAYARLRHVGNSDWERTERQRRVIAEMIRKSKTMSLVDMDRLANKILPQIKTDITEAEAAQLLVDLLDYRNYTIQEFRVPEDGTFTNQIIDGMDVMTVDFLTNSQDFKQLVYGSIELDEEGNEDMPAIE